MAAFELGDYVITLHGVARGLASPGNDRDLVILAQRARDLADELAEVANRTEHPERYPVNHQDVMEKKRIVEKLGVEQSAEMWKRQRLSAGESLGRAPTPEEVEASPEVTGGFLEFHPLLAYDPISDLQHFNVLYWQAAQDYKNSCARGDGELEKAKRLASVQMMTDARDKAIDALVKWAALLAPLPNLEPGE